MTGKTLLKYLLNPCDMDRHPALAALGDGVARLWRVFTAGTECPCCLGFRLLATISIAFTVGAVLF